ncbi:MAG: DNA repair protein RecO [Gemmatimonadales bacterium]
MPPITTTAVILGAIPYRETSRIVRLATRDLGVQSAIAKGALRPHSRFGHSLQPLTEGTAMLHLARSSDLHLLIQFDADRIRIGLADRLDRYSAAVVLAELMIRFAPASRHQSSFELLRDALAILEVAPAAAVEPLALRSLWRLVAVLGFAPALEICVRCGAPVGSSGICFSAQDGGVLCQRCARGIAGAQLRLSDRAALGAFLDPEAELPVLDERHLAAHRRLLERYIRYHLAEGAALPALAFWAERSWLAA